MQRIVINKCYGGYGLSKRAVKLWFDLSGATWTPSFFSYDIPRDDSHLVKVVEELKEEANGSHAELKVVEVPDGVEWEIEGYDGLEWVSEKHRTWS